jgi:hypothetical protein
MFSTKIRTTMIAALTALSLAAVPAVSEAKGLKGGLAIGEAKAGAEKVTQDQCNALADLYNSLTPGPPGTNGVGAVVGQGVLQYAHDHGCALY